MSDDIKVSPISKDSMVIAGERLKAQIAMEGVERRKKREENIRKEREAAERVRQEKENEKKELFEKEKIERERREQELRSIEDRNKTSIELRRQVSEIKESGSRLETIRTLKADQANLIKGQNISVIGIAIKEEERRRQRQENSSLSSGKNITLLVASLTLIVLSLGVGFYVYRFYYAETPIQIIQGKDLVQQSILFADTSRSLDITDITPEELIDRIKNEVKNPPDLRLGAVENFVFSKKNVEGLRVPISTDEFFETIGSEGPANFLRTLDKEYMFGILSSAENAAFIILKTESYGIGWAGLLDWDGKTLTKDLYQVLTSIKPEKELLTKQFEDLTIRNIDTRVLKDKDGIVRIVYGFLDGEKIIAIAGSRQAFIEAKNRFNTPRPIRR